MPNVAAEGIRIQIGHCEQLIVICFQKCPILSNQLLTFGHLQYQCVRFWNIRLIQISITTHAKNQSEYNLVQKLRNILIEDSTNLEIENIRLRSFISTDTIINQTNSSFFEYKFMSPPGDNLLANIVDHYRQLAMSLIFAI